MEQSLIQRARDIAADTFIRLEMKRPTDGMTAKEWASQIQSYARFTREGAYDNDREVQVAIAALRAAEWSPTPPALPESDMAQLIAEDEAAERREAAWERAKAIADANREG